MITVKTGFTTNAKKKYIEKTSLKLEARKTHFVTLSVQEVLNSETLILSEIPQTAKRKRTLCFGPHFNYFQKIKQLQNGTLG